MDGSSRPKPSTGGSCGTAGEVKSLARPEYAGSRNLRSLVLDIPILEYYTELNI